MDLRTLLLEELITTEIRLAAVGMEQTMPLNPHTLGISNALPAALAAVIIIVNWQEACGAVE